ncbi:MULTISPECIES: maltose operon protein MalM [Xenorhabdus]|uniref:Maltose operon protein n=1 Tax=Xenorhabdus ehlersii TaxID=290111 RepID=A0A2D0IZN6_9GAMM|nr:MULTISPECIES: maltose operon protein MalM [Xenorhabdus]MBC8947475.1 maltose operon protein MalM [Xenorhabdus sp. TS4]PHM27235.1 maltose operon protein MalM [Xenorhabdus ehlersii]RKE87451.1 maltose operon protein [Xenorhabdus ehlersii]
MKKQLLSLCLSALFCNMIPAVSYAASDIALSDTATSGIAITNRAKPGIETTSAAPTLPLSTLQKLQWQPINTHDTQTIILESTSQQLNDDHVQGAVATFALPANQGSLAITLNSLIKDKQVYSPNVLVFDEQLHPAAFYPSHYFRYQQPGIMSTDRLEGVLKLTPALGQQRIYLLIYTTRSDLQASTQMVDPAKAYAKGVGNSVPDIPDPIAHHTETGTLTLKVQSESNAGNILIGQVFSSPTPKPVTIGSTQVSTSPLRTTPTDAPQSAAPVVKPVLNDTERYFNDAIKRAINNGDVDKALKLLDEAERLGSPTARETFIKMIKNKK